MASRKPPRKKKSSKSAPLCFPKPYAGPDMPWDRPYLPGMQSEQLPLFRRPVREVPSPEDVEEYWRQAPLPSYAGYPEPEYGCEVCGELENCRCGHDEECHCEDGCCGPRKNPWMNPIGVVKTARDERLWRMAKRSAAQQGRVGDWRYIMGIFLRMKHRTGGSDAAR